MSLIAAHTSCIVCRFIVFFSTASGCGQDGSFGSWPTNYILVDVPSFQGYRHVRIFGISPSGTYAVMEARASSRPDRTRYL